MEPRKVCQGPRHVRQAILHRACPTVLAFGNVGGAADVLYGDISIDFSCCSKRKRHASFLAEGSSWLDTTVAVTRRCAPALQRLGLLSVEDLGH